MKSEQRREKIKRKKLHIITSVMDISAEKLIWGRVFNSYPILFPLHRPNDIGKGTHPSYSRYGLNNGSDCS